MFLSRQLFEDGFTALLRSFSIWTSTFTFHFQCLTDLQETVVAVCLAISMPAAAQNMTKSVSTRIAIIQRPPILKSCQSHIYDQKSLPNVFKKKYFFSAPNRWIGGLNIGNFLTIGAVGSVVNVARLSCFEPPCSGFTRVQSPIMVKL